jgi:hypothetical protein
VFTIEGDGKIAALRNLNQREGMLPGLLRGDSGIVCEQIRGAPLAAVEFLVTEICADFNDLNEVVAIC